MWGVIEALAGSPPRPVIVLVRPQLGENIGKAARAMLNFGLTEMRLVSPRDGWPNPDAGPSAAGADAVLDKAEVFETLADAVADCAHVYATTVRKRGVTKPVVTPEEAAREIHGAAGRVREAAYARPPVRKNSDCGEGNIMPMRARSEARKSMSVCMARLGSPGKFSVLFKPVALRSASHP